jgi:uncharacterized protein (UPF0264 family)
VRNQRLLVSVRGRNDASEAVAGGAHIIDVEYPGSALGTPYPLNIQAVRQHVPGDRMVATNIGEKQHVWATASQAALGVAMAGADIIKVGLAELRPGEAIHVMERVVRNVKRWAPEKTLIAVFFADEELRKIVDPVTQAHRVAMSAKTEGILIDTYFKERGRGLLDWLTLRQLDTFVENCHKSNIEAWIAGSISKEQMAGLWKTGVDVICIREAATEKIVSGRMGKVSEALVRDLVRTIP